MKRSFTFLLIIFFAIGQSQAQYYTTPLGSGNPNNINPEDLEYSVGGGLPSSWVLVQSGLLNIPVWSAVQNLPFAFNFNGTPVTSYKVSTSGVLTFSTASTGAAPSSLNSNLPSASIPANSICVWGLSGKGSNDNIVTKTFGTAPNRQLWISFNDYSLPTIFNSHYTYWSIVLEESTDHIYIVDQRKSTALTTALTVGIQINSSLAYSISGSPSVNAASADNPTRTDNIYYTFEPGTQPNLDLKGLKILLEEIIAVNQGPFAIQFVCENLGSDTITSLDLHYTTPTGAKTTASLTNLTILPWQVDTLQHPIAWLPVACQTTLLVWAENLNGAADEVLSNDTAQQELTIINQSASRVAFLESFTSSTSVPSSTFNTNLQSTLATQTLPVHIKYPMNWPGTGDPYFTNEGSARRLFYAVSTLPNLQLDGQDWSNFNNSIDSTILAEAANKMTLVELEASFYTIGQTVCTDINLKPLVQFNNPNLTLYVAVFEKKSTNNAKNSGETAFYHVVKKMLPNANGTPITALSAGLQHQESFCYTFAGTYILPPNANSPVNFGTNNTVEEFSDLGVAVWLQDNATKEVLQAANAADSTGSIPFEMPENNAQNLNVNVFPNPATGQVFVSLHLTENLPVELDLTSLAGQHLLREKHPNVTGNVVLPVSLPQLSAGLYLLNVRVGDKIISKKLRIE